MASLSINKRKKSNGDIRYLALIRVSKNGNVVYNESRTFSKNAAAKSWGSESDEIQYINRNYIDNIDYDRLKKIDNYYQDER
ncbi:hypothetical protein AADZ91_00325 [Colwelliaceae bacterium 6441]